MLYTNLFHIEKKAEFVNFVTVHENCIVCIGKMNHSSVAMFNLLEKIERKYKHLAIADFEFENPESRITGISDADMDVNSLPALVYIKNSEIVRKTYGTDTQKNIENTISELFGISQKLKTIKNK